MEYRVSLEHLEDFAVLFWKQAGNERRFAFHGAMGAGKTTLILALCKARGVKETMGSPTFSIINLYTFRENGREQQICHMDLYRLKDEEEVVQAGVEDSLFSGAVCLVEWPEKAPGLFEEHTVHIYIEPINECERRVKVVFPWVSLAEQS